MIRTVVRLAIAAALVPTAVALAQCPPNYIGGYFTGPGGAPIYAAAERDSMCPYPPPYACPAPGVWRVIWNLTTGDASCEGATTCGGESQIIRGDVGVFTADDYVLTGPASSDPVSFSAVLHVLGSSGQGCSVDCSSGFGCVTRCNFGTLLASLKEGTQVADALPSASVDRDLLLVLSKSVGQHFQLDMTLRALPACNALATLASHLTFVLPSGYGIQSCYGYRSAAPTAGLRASWGRVKSLYR